MKKLVFASMMQVLLGLFPVSKARAVWAPSTSLNKEEANAASGEACQVLDKLRQDERRLDEALHALEEDEKQLKRLAEEPSR